MAPYRAAVEGVGVLQRAVDDGGVGEDDEAEAAGAAGELVAHDGGLGDLAVGGEVLAQLLLRRLPGDAADEELALVRLHLSASAPLRALACCGGEGGWGREGERNWGFQVADLGLGAEWFRAGGGYFRAGAWWGPGRRVFRGFFVGRFSYERNLIQRGYMGDQNSTIFLFYLEVPSNYNILR